jgi:hypothetical protein
MTEPLPFIDYWDAVDAAMVKLFGIDTFDAGIEADCIATAQDESTSPEDFALWFGEKYGLRLKSEFDGAWGQK